jgi:tRNA threonylcarbamoyladenosine biosynthesis protein TsaE
MNRLTLVVDGEDGTERLGAVLADTLPDGAVVALCGTLGSGKTRLLQAIAVACGVPRREVVSPTFVLCQQYRGRRTINHFDAYRIRDEDEFLQLGPQECFESDGLTFVEWGDRVAGCLPSERIEVDIEVTEGQSRRFCVAAVGERFRPFLEQLQNRWRAAKP